MVVYFVISSVTTTSVSADVGFDEATGVVATGGAPYPPMGWVVLNARVVSAAALAMRPAPTTAIKFLLTILPEE